MKWIERLVIRVTQIGVGLAFFALISTVLIQVIGRAIGTSPVWTEELTRFALLFMVAFGGGLSLHSKELVNVDLVCESLPAPWPRRLQIVSYLFVIALGAILFQPALRFASIGSMQTSPALGLRMDIAHASVVILLAGLVLYSLLGLLTLYRRSHEKQASEETDKWT
ncbi:TRAP-type C4-dicarboxylate transport system, small permease component [Cohaesibacter sp. ES.047]|uniref:TRAP transporter small permease n=1 Tax=Cohaesibacter sp. ES.047 TaxID=1798205 RepID=UPI000BB82CA4|nr:TRAP transporter small permease [Cohaesibacter sp. ES.047]SNY92238.1 TRAP-type C4-dicarboxylate transport system, small permease component [Cohaesibacter sp. ES.047]